MTVGFCLQCSVPLKPEAKFCAGCGTAINVGIGVVEPENIGATVPSPSVFKGYNKYLAVAFAAIALIILFGVFFAKPKLEPDCLNADEIAAGLTCAQKYRGKTERVVADELIAPAAPSLTTGLVQHNALPPPLSPAETEAGIGRFEATAGDQDIIMESNPTGSRGQFGFTRIWYLNRATGNRCSAHLVLDREDYLPEPENRYDLTEAYYYKQVVLNDDKPCAKQLMIYFTYGMQAWSGAWIENGQTVMQADFTQ